MGHGGQDGFLRLQNNVGDDKREHIPAVFRPIAGGEHPVHGAPGLPGDSYLVPPY